MSESALDDLLRTYAIAAVVGYFYCKRKYARSEGEESRKYDPDIFIAYFFGSTVLMIGAYVSLQLGYGFFALIWGGIRWVWAFFAGGNP